MADVADATIAAPAADSRLNVADRLADVAAADAGRDRGGVPAALVAAIIACRQRRIGRRLRDDDVCRAGCRRHAHCARTDRMGRAARHAAGTVGAARHRVRDAGVRAAAGRHGDRARRPGLGAAESGSLPGGGGAGRIRGDRHGPGGSRVVAAQVSARKVERDGRPAVVLGRDDARCNCGSST